MKLIFYKYQATGNDFVIIDNRKGDVILSYQQVKEICDRRFGVGSDGLMLLNSSPAYDFEMKYYNADGKEGSMCGNGGRCLVRFAFDMGIKKNSYHFIATDGVHEADMEDGWINLKMQDVNNIRYDGGDAILNTGSPHYVKQVNDIMKIDVYKEGRAIRYSRPFQKEGINVNFVDVCDDDCIRVRTYERGVEDETCSCGTGVTAAALVFAHNDIGFNRIEVKTKGGDLAVEFDKIAEDKFTNIWLCGPAEFVFKGEIEV